MVTNFSGVGDEAKQPANDPVTKTRAKQPAYDPVTMPSLASLPGNILSLFSSVFRWFTFTQLPYSIVHDKFGTLPFRLFGSNLDTRDLETYPRSYSGHF